DVKPARIRPRFARAAVALFADCRLDIDGELPRPANAGKLRSMADHRCREKFFVLQEWRAGRAHLVDRQIGVGAKLMDADDIPPGILGRRYDGVESNVNAIRLLGERRSSPILTADIQLVCDSDRGCPV